MDASPTKRRALAPIDVNSRNPTSISKPKVSKRQVLSPSPSRIGYSAPKRPLDAELYRNQSQYRLTQPAKRQRVSTSEDVQFTTVDEDEKISRHSPDDGDDAHRQHSDSADEEESSILDNSAIDTSQDTTTITEPDAEVPAPMPQVQAPPRRERTISREEARRKAEMLRLRLGLASYKVRTGQTDVPLDRLKIKPLLNSSSTCGKPRQYDEQLCLPPLPRVGRTGGDVEGEGEDEERHSRPAAVTCRALSTARPPVELAIPSSDTAREPLTEEGHEHPSSHLSGIAARVLLSTSQSS